MLTLGIDLGSRTVKGILYDAEECRVLAACVSDVSTDSNRDAHAIRDAVLSESGKCSSQVERVVATGYGRSRADFASFTSTEITCHAMGVSLLIPQAHTVIDIGGQDSKAIHLEGEGMVRDFAMNDRCAAGTGNFLAVLAEKLEVPIDRFGPLAMKSRKPVAISSLCVVMAESEILSLVAAETPIEDIVAGLHFALARRIANMAAALDVGDEVVFTGGVAQNAGMKQALESAFGLQLTVARMPLFAAALGAALS